MSSSSNRWTKRWVWSAGWSKLWVFRDTEWSSGSSWDWNAERWCQGSSTESADSDEHKSEVWNGGCWVWSVRWSKLWVFRDAEWSSGSSWNWNAERWSHGSSSWNEQPTVTPIAKEKEKLWDERTRPKNEDAAEYKRQWIQEVCNIANGSTAKQMEFFDAMDLHDARHLHRYCPKAQMRLTVRGAPLSGTIPMGRLDRRKLKNIRLKKHPALKALDLILEGVDRAIAIETRARDAARLQFRRDGILLVTNATTGNRYRVCMQNLREACALPGCDRSREYEPGCEWGTAVRIASSLMEALIQRRATNAPDGRNISVKKQSSRQLYLMLRLTIPKLPGSASLGLWYEEVSGESLRQVRIDASDSTRVENFAGRGSSSK
jgi:hypothetical protein